MDQAGIALSAAEHGRARPRAPSWRGFPCQQFCSDLWRYAELVHELRPPWVLETGTADGGTALFLADALGEGGRVISIDNDPRPVAIDRRNLVLLKGDAADPATAARVTAIPGAGRRRGLILLDDDHSSAHVLAELDLWAPLASYLVVEDTLMGHLPQYADGPHLAVAKWLPEHPEFTQDPEPVPSNHPGGWLRRVAG